MKIGVTATRMGLTGAQKNTVARLLAEHDVTTAHHGDCVGGDQEFHELARACGARVVVHPPDSDRLRAFCSGDIVRAKKPYLERNRDIVDEVELLIVCPKETTEPKPARGQGTWSTARYARKINRASVVVWPDGTTR